MPRVTWGVKAAAIDDYDRESQYAPYDGPQPPNGVYVFRIKVLKSIAATRDKNPQLRVGLQLQPRKTRKEERKLDGYFIMAFIPVTEKTEFRYVPFLDAIGVSGKEFERGTVADTEGNISKIGRWRNTGDVLIKAEIKDGQDLNGDSRKEVGWMGAYAADDPDTDDEDDDALDDDFDDDDPDADYEEDDEEY